MSLPLCLASLLATLAATAVPAAAAKIAPAAPAVQPTVAQAPAECPAVALTQPFLKWGDSNSYELVAGGSFEGSLAGWTLGSGVQKAAGSESFGVTGAVGSSSLALAAGATAQSPFTCVDSRFLTFRFFARTTGSSAQVLVHVTYETPIGVVSVPVGTVTVANGWQPSPAMPTGAQYAEQLLGGTAQMALTFTAVTGSADIDDVLVDPRMR